ncbi:DUF2946 domain-containing protein [Salinicola halimionae]|uniref:DUF2946 domain-containing protein n=1 Tax=Salinicola halimionae TaxID=1949081 RepID=UPI000DA17C24|nr:DUF2946 domain-containing protein [Salinicola halimionae]
MTHFWHRWYRSLTALALFAMLMAFTGPLISQMQRLMEMPTGAVAGMPRQVDSKLPPHGESRMVDTHIVHHFDMTACGYCELFLHTPGLAPPRVMPPLTPPPAGFLTLTIETSSATAPVYPRYASRAPPRT